MPESPKTGLRGRRDKGTIRHYQVKQNRLGDISLKNIKKRLLRWLLISLSFCVILAIAGFFQYQHNAQTRAAIGTLEQIKRPSQHGEIIISFYHASPPEAVTPHEQAVVLIPSLARPASDFNELASALNAAGYETYLLEPRGMRDDSGVVLEDITLFDLADDLAALYAHLQTNQMLADTQIILIGHAFGNRVARSFATKYSDKTDSVILLAAGGVATGRGVVAAFAVVRVMLVLWGRAGGGRCGAGRCAVIVAAWAWQAARVGRGGGVGTADGGSDGDWEPD